MRAFVCSVLVFAWAAAFAGEGRAQGAGGCVSILVCKRDAEAGAAAGPQVAFFERSHAEVAVCEASSPPDFCAAAAGIAAGMPCAEALAALRSSAPDFVQTKVVQSGRPLLIFAEDVEGEALATIVPRRPSTDIIFDLGTEHGEHALVGCDVFSRRNATITMFDQSGGDNGAGVSRHDDLMAAPTCAETLTLFQSDGVPLRGKTAVSRALPTRSKLLILDEPTASEAAADRFGGHYLVTTVAHVL